MATENSRKRRRYGADLRAQILAECDVPGASVAKVAMAYCVNAKIVHGWRKFAREAEVTVIAGRARRYTSGRYFAVLHDTSRPFDHSAAAA